MKIYAFPWDDKNPDPILFLNNVSGVLGRKPFHFGVGDLYHTFIDLCGRGGHDIINVTYAPPEDY